ncbi:MAG: AAA family ATPase [Treponema sp.]|nr:AAA family ATPase [Treponema sp.]
MKTKGEKRKVPCLREIEFENFKGFKSKTILKISPLTLLSGLNGAGKSTIAQILVLLKQSFFGNGTISDENEIPFLVLNGNYIKLGEVSDILNDSNRDLNFSFLFNDDTRISFSFRPIKVTQKNAFQNKEKYILRLVCFIFEDKSSNFQSVFNEDSWNIISYLSLGFYNYELQNLLQEYFKELYGNEENYDFNEVLKETVQFSNVKKISFFSLFLQSIIINFTDIKNCISDKYVEDFSEKDFMEFVSSKTNEIGLDEIQLNFGFEKCLNYFNVIRTLRYFEPFRGLPQRIYDESDEKNPLDILNKSTTDNVAYRYDFDSNKIISGSIKDAISYWLDKQFSLADGYEINELVNNLVSEAIIYEHGKKFTINNVGFGVSQILPLVSGILVLNNPLVIVDEPECHLHPGLQSKVGEFLLNMCMIGKTIIVETHSEHIINILTYYSLKYEKVSKMLKSYWIYKNKDSSCIKEIVYDEYGFPQNAPEGFYDENEKIVQALADIRAEKMLK